MCTTSVFVEQNSNKRSYGLIDNKCKQRNRPITATSQTGPIASEPTPMDEGLEHAGEDMSHMQINTNQKDTHHIESKCASSLMKIVDW